MPLAATTNAFDAGVPSLPSFAHALEGSWGFSFPPRAPLLSSGPIAREGETGSKLPTGAWEE